MTRSDALRANWKSIIQNIFDRRRMFVHNDSHMIIIAYHEVDLYCLIQPNLYIAFGRLLCFLFENIYMQLFYLMYWLAKCSLVGFASFNNLQLLSKSLLSTPPISLKIVLACISFNLCFVEYDVTSAISRLWNLVLLYSAYIIFILTKIENVRESFVTLA